MCMHFCFAVQCFGLSHEMDNYMALDVTPVTSADEPVGIFSPKKKKYFLLVIQWLSARVHDGPSPTGDEWRT